MTAVGLLAYAASVMPFGLSACARGGRLLSDAVVTLFGS